MTIKRRIRSHKGGRTARAPAARITPAMLERIRETMRERKVSFADLLEEQYTTGDDTMDPDMKKQYQNAVKEAGSIEEVFGIKKAIEIEYGSKHADEICNRRLAELQPGWLDRILGTEK